MQTMNIRITFTEPVLGTAPSDETIYSSYIGANAPDAKSLQEEIAALGTDEVERNGMTVFARTPEGKPALWNYHVEGFFKDACGMLARLKPQDFTDENGKKKKSGGTKSSQLKAYKKVIDGLIFVQPRLIPIEMPGDGAVGTCQRSLRAQTAQGERVALASSEEVPAGSSIRIQVELFDESHAALVREWLNYGRWRGIGQWRNSGKGRFLFHCQSRR